MDAENKKELWDHLDPEPERAYRAFESYLTLPSSERTILEAYRRQVGNPEAAKPSDTWSGWSRQYAWRERAAAYDNYLASLRRGAYERGVQEEAERQGAIAERNRNRMSELMTLSYERAVECLEDETWVNNNLRTSDVIQIIKLHMEAVKTFEAAEEPKEDHWTEEDDEVVETILRELEGEEDLD